MKIYIYDHLIKYKITRYVTTQNAKNNRIWEKKQMCIKSIDY